MKRLKRITALCLGVLMCSLAPVSTFAETVGIENGSAKIETMEAETEINENTETIESETKIDESTETIELETKIDESTETIEPETKTDESTETIETETQVSESIETIESGTEISETVVSTISLESDAARASTVTGKQVLDELKQLSSSYESTVKDKDSASEFYSEMIAIYKKAFYNDELLETVSKEELKAIDEVFANLQNKLYDDYRYTEVPTINKNEVSTTSLENAANSVFRTTTSNSEEKVYTYKSVVENQKGGYTLTLESYVTGSSINYVKPVDVILVLDQSASMYAPMGVKSGLAHNKLSTANSEDMSRYALDSGSAMEAIGCEDLKKAFMATTADDKTGLTFQEKVSQLGYLVAQSRIGGEYYVNKAHDDGCGKSQDSDSVKNHGDTTYDWFVIQYVEDDEKPWHFYRIPHTACPSTDGLRIGLHNNISGADSNNPILIKYASLDEIGDAHYYFYESQTGALYDSITALAKSLHDSDGNHRLAVTGFASGNQRETADGKKITQSSGSGIYVGSDTSVTYHLYNDNSKSENGKFPTYYYNNSQNHNVYAESTLTTEQYKAAFMRVRDNYTGVLNAINAVKTDYYQTYQDVGLDIALHILENSERKLAGDLEDRRKVVIMFTDGEPAGPTKADVVDKASQIKALKYKDGTPVNAEIYTVCTSTLPETGRAFLTYSSSNYPNAKVTFQNDYYTVDKDKEKYAAIDQGKEQSKDYAKTAKNAKELQDAFLEVIKDVGGAHIDLGAETVLQDAISEYFALPSDLVNVLQDSNATEATKNQEIQKSVRVYTADCTSYNETTHEITFAEKQVFSDAKVSVNTDKKGTYRLVKVTNFDYADNFISEKGRGGKQDFRGKKLIVEIDIQVASDNLGGNQLPTNDEIDSGIYKNEVKEATFKTPTVDVATSVTVKKQVVGTNADLQKKFSFNVGQDVFKEYITNWEDEQAKRPVDGNYLQAVWNTGSEQNKTFQLAHEEKKVLSGVKVGSTLTISEAKDDFYEVSVKVLDKDEQDITSEVCKLQSDGSYQVQVKPSMTIVYTNEMVRADLIISKTGIQDVDHHAKDTTGEEEVQSSIFEVEGPDGFKMQVVIPGNSSVTIKNVPIGKYTVRELTDWSWRYEATPSSKNVTVKSVWTTGENQVSFENNRTQQYWLSGDNYCENRWNVESKVEEKDYQHKKNK